MAFKLNHIHLKSPDPRKTVQWYVDYMGATVLSERETANDSLYFRISLNGVEANVTDLVQDQVLERQFYGLEHVAMDTDSYDADVAAVKASGARVLEERTSPGQRRVCFFEGPEGVQVELLEMS